MDGDILFNDVLAKLAEIHEQFPDLRLGAVIQNSVDKFRTESNINLNDKSTKDILAALTEFQRQTRIQRGVQ